MGRGRSTLVYTAEDLTSGDEVAIKLLASSLTRNVGFMRRFRHVMRSACSFDHPNVARVIAWGEERELFVVTEPAVGPLRALMLPGKGLSQGQTAALAVDVSRGLAYLAQRNLVHRRLHPSNLLIASDGRVMVSDAALAWILAHESGHQFSDFRYLAPEAGSGTTGPPTDVYALGMIMAEALTGDIPLLAGDVNATLGLRHETDLTLDGRWGRIGRAVGATGRADPERRVPAGQLDVGLMALIAQMDRSEVELPRMDPTVRSDELESMRLTLRDRLPTVAAQTTATPGTPVGMAAEAPTPSRAHDDHRAAAADQAKPIDPPKPAPVPRRQPAAAQRSSAPAEQQPAEQQPAEQQPAEHQPAGVESNSLTPEELAVRRNWVIGLVAALVVVLALLVGVQRFVLSSAAEVPKVVGATVDEVRAQAADGRWRLNTTEVRRDNTKTGEVLTQDPAAGTKLRAGESLDVTVSLGPTLVALPELEGLSQKDAENIITFAGMKLGDVESDYNADAKPGTVMSISAEFAEGTKLSKGSTVNLVVSDGAKPRQIPKELVGKNALSVVAELEKAQLKPVVEPVQEPSVALNYVVSVEPPEGSQVTIGDEVKVRVSAARENVAVPNVVGKSAAAADLEVRAVGLTVLGIEGPAGGTVERTDPEVGAEVPQGTSIRLVTR